MKRILGVIGALLLMAAGATVLYGQQPNSIPRGVSQMPGPSASPGIPGNPDDEHGPPAIQYTVAAVITIMIMVILCMPSRKKR